MSSRRRRAVAADDKHPAGHAPGRHAGLWGLEDRQVALDPVQPAARADTTVSGRAGAPGYRDPRRGVAPAPERERGRAARHPRGPRPGGRCARDAGRGRAAARRRSRAGRARRSHALAGLEPVGRPGGRRALRGGAPRDGGAGLARRGRGVQPRHGAGPRVRRGLEQARHGALPGDPLRDIHRRLRRGRPIEPAALRRARPARGSATWRSGSSARPPAASGAPSTVHPRLETVRQHLARAEDTLARANGHALGVAPADARGSA